MTSQRRELLAKLILYDIAPHDCHGSTAQCTLQFTAILTINAPMSDRTRPLDHRTREFSLAAPKGDRRKWRITPPRRSSESQSNCGSPPSAFERAVYGWFRVPPSPKLSIVGEDQDNRVIWAQMIMIIVAGQYCITLTMWKISVLAPPMDMRTWDF